MFCRNCGKEIADNAIVCIHCGVATGNSMIANNTVTVDDNQKKPVNGFAIAGLVLGIVGLLGGNFLFLIPSIVGLVLSIVGMVKAKQYSLYGLALAALIVNIVAFAFWLMVWIFAFAEAITAPYYYYYY